MKKILTLLFIGIASFFITTDISALSVSFYNESHPLEWVDNKCVGTATYIGLYERLEDKSTPIRPINPSTANSGGFNNDIFDHFYNGLSVTEEKQNLQAIVQNNIKSIDVKSVTNGNILETVKKNFSGDELDHFYAFYYNLQAFRMFDFYKTPYIEVRNTLTREQKEQMLQALFVDQTAKISEYSFIGSPKAVKTNKSSTSWGIVNENNSLFINDERPVSTESDAMYKRVFFPLAYELLITYDFSKENCNLNVEKVEPTCVTNLSFSNKTTMSGTYNNANEGLALDSNKLVASSNETPGWNFTEPVLNEKTGKCEFDGVYLSASTIEYNLFDGETKRRFGNNILNSNFQTTNDVITTDTEGVIPKKFTINYSGKTAVVNISNNSEFNIIGYSNNMTYSELVGSDSKLFSNLVNKGYNNISGKELYTYSLNPKSYTSTVSKGNTNSYSVTVKNTIAKNTYVANYKGTSFCNGGYNKNDTIFKELLANTYKNKITCSVGSNSICNKRISTLFAPVKIQVKFTLSDTSACKTTEYVDTVCTIKGNFNKPYTDSTTGRDSYATGNGVDLNSSKISGVILNEDGTKNPRYGFTKPEITEDGKFCQFKVVYLSSTSHQINLAEDGTKTLSIGDENIDILNGQFTKNYTYDHFNENDLVNPSLPKEFTMLLSNGQKRNIKIPDVNTIFISGVTNNISLAEMKGTSFLNFTQSFTWAGNFNNLTSNELYANSLHPGSYTASAILKNSTNGYNVDVSRTFIKGSSLASIGKKGFCEGGYYKGDDYFKEVDSASNNNKNSVLFAPVKIELTVKLSPTDPACEAYACTVEGVINGKDNNTKNFTKGVFENSQAGLNFDSKEIVAKLENSNRYGFTEPKLDENGVCYAEGLYISSPWQGINVNEETFAPMLILEKSDDAKKFDLNESKNVIPENVLQDQNDYYDDLKLASLPSEFNMVFNNGTSKPVKLIITGENPIKIMGVSNNPSKSELNTYFINSFVDGRGDVFYNYSINPGAYLVATKSIETYKDASKTYYGISVSRTFIAGQSLVNPEYKPFCDLGDKECTGCSNTKTQLYAPVKVQFRINLEAEACVKQKSKCDDLLLEFKKNNNEFDTIHVSQKEVDEAKCCDVTVVTEEQYASYVEAGMCPDPTPEKPKVCEGSLDIACCDEDGNFDIENGGEVCVQDKCKMLESTDTTKLSLDDKNFINKYCCYELDNKGANKYNFSTEICPPKVDKCTELSNRYNKSPISLSHEEKVYLYETCNIPLDKECTDGYVWDQNQNKCILICEPGEPCPRPNPDPESDFIIPCKDILNFEDQTEKENNKLSYGYAETYFFKNSTAENSLYEISCSMSMVGVISKESNKVVAGHLLPFSYSPALLTPTYSCINRMVDNSSLRCTAATTSACNVNNAYSFKIFDNKGNYVCNPYCDTVINGEKRFSETCNSLLTELTAPTCEKREYLHYGQIYTDCKDISSWKGSSACFQKFKEIDKCESEKRIFENKQTYCLNLSKSYDDATTVDNVYNTKKIFDKTVADFQKLSVNYDKKEQELEAAIDNCSININDCDQFGYIHTVDPITNTRHTSDGVPTERNARDIAKSEYYDLKNQIIEFNDYTLNFSLGMSGMSVAITESGIRNIYEYKAPTNEKGEPIETPTYTSNTDKKDKTSNGSSIGTNSTTVNKATADGGGTLTIYEYWTREIRTDNLSPEEMRKLTYTFPDVYYMSKVDYGIITADAYNKLTDPNKAALYKKIEGMYLTSRDSDVTKEGNEIDIYFYNVKNTKELNNLSVNVEINDCIYYLSDAKCFPYCEIPSIESPILEIDNELVVVNWPNGGGDNFEVVDNSDKDATDNNSSIILSNLNARQVDTKKAFSNKNSVSSNWAYIANDDVYKDIFREDVYPNINAIDSAKFDKALYVIKLDSANKEAVLNYNETVGNNYNDFENFKFNADGVSGTSKLLEDLGGSLITKNPTNIENNIRRYTSFGVRYYNITGNKGYNEALLEYIKGGK